MQPKTLKTLQFSVMVYQLTAAQHDDYRAKVLDRLRK